MEVEEEWLMETGGRMMEERSVHCNMEFVNAKMGGRCKDDFIETEVYVEFNFIDWLVADLKDMGVEDRVIAIRVRPIIGYTDITDTDTDTDTDNRYRYRYDLII